MFMTLLASTAIVLSLGLFAPESEANGECTEGTLGAILGSFGPGFDTDQNDFDIVREALTLFPGLVAAACDETEELTVFLPTDKAFRILVEDLGFGSIKDEEALFNAIAGLLGAEGVLDVLTFHIAPAVYTSDIVLGAGDGFEVETLNPDNDIVLRFKGKGAQIRLQDGEPSLRNPIVRIVDIEAVNGVAHVIDRVLVPEGLLD